MADRIEVLTNGGPWSTDRQTWASDVETWAGDTGYLEQVPGPDGPTHFIRLGRENLTPRAVGDLIVDPNVAAIDFDTGWIYPTFQNGWSNYGSGYQGACYRRSAGVVNVQGLVKGGSIGAYTIITLASGYRPKDTIIYSTMDTGNQAPEQMRCYWSGNIQARTGSNAWQTLALCFYADGS